MSKPTIYVTGSNGLVASRFVELYSKQFNLLTPEIDKLNILNQNDLDSFFKKEKPDYCIHFAAFTDVNSAEQQRGQKSNSCWKVNVLGTKNIVNTCKNYKTQLVYISTDMVFPGSPNFPGPYAENIIPPGNLRELTWYGYTKLKAEQIVRKYLKKYSIVRINYPVRAKYTNKSDIFRNIINLYDKGSLYPLFDDQQITITYIDDLCRALAKIISTNSQGIFHVASNVTTPHKSAEKLLKKARNFKGKLSSQTIDGFLEKSKSPSFRYPKLAGLLSEKTQKVLDLRFKSVTNIISNILIQNPNY